MSTIGLTEEALETIKKKPILFGKVCDALGIVPSSLTRLLLTNHPKLTQAGVLKVINEYSEETGEQINILNSELSITP